jgi:hypothetical protein
MGGVSLRAYAPAGSRGVSMKVFPDTHGFPLGGRRASNGSRLSATASAASGNVAVVIVSA